MSVLIKTAPDIDSEKALSRYLCPFQVEGVECSARYQFTVKANRIGWTWIDSLKNVRLRLQHKKRDYLFTTQNWNGALEYGRYLDQWIDLYNLGRMIISRSEEMITIKDAEGIARQEKVGIYKFDTGSRIILFSSSPWAIQTFEGDVGWDEAAFHEQQQNMYTALITRIAWGYNISIWSAHNGIGSWFNQVLGKIASAPKSPWHTRKIDIYKAIEDGLVERINQRSGMNMTREEFLADCRARALTPAIFAERFECNPSDAGTNIVTWSVLEACRDVPSILRHHMDNAEVCRLFGPHTSSGPARIALIQNWMRQKFGDLTTKLTKYRIGFDVAASGKGDLGSFWIDERNGDKLIQRALLTTQTEDWDFMQAALEWFMRELPDARGAGDSTGLGRQICWTVEARNAGRFIGVPFTRPSKSSLGTRLMMQLSDGTRRIPASLAADGTSTGNDDIAMDLFSLQKEVAGGQVIFKETPNSLNAASHCDIAWSAALAGEADASTKSGIVTMTLC